MQLSDDHKPEREDEAVSQSSYVVVGRKISMKIRRMSVYVTCQI